MKIKTTNNIKSYPNEKAETAAINISALFL